MYAHTSLLYSITDYLVYFLYYCSYNKITYSKFVKDGIVIASVKVRA